MRLVLTVSIFYMCVASFEVYGTSIRNRSERMGVCAFWNKIQFACGDILWLLWKIPVFMVGKTICKDSKNIRVIFVTYHSRDRVLCFYTSHLSIILVTSRMSVFWNQNYWEVNILADIGKTACIFLKSFLLVRFFKKISS